MDVVDCSMQLEIFAVLDRCQCGLSLALAYKSLLRVVHSRIKSNLENQSIYDIISVSFDNFLC